ncbi:IS1096 element passenger TnpR family protein [Tenacibaculum sp. 190524A02b]|uniref:Plasmid pRiA4b Orf3-like domain-containing protein n=1 Tax=Tenacibaculum vairaonense TaxID=3137860 RepID=A0ABP1FDK3_9FLAO
MYKVRAILDTEEDVIRTLMIDEKKSLEELHSSVAKAFGFEGNEMASFYRTDDEWNQGEEIPLFSMAEAGEGISMASCIIRETLPKLNDKLIYVYDFLDMWTFFIELVEQTDTKAEEKVILEVGEVPKEAPNKIFKADDFLNDSGEEGFKDEFESLDDFDFDNY